jgi:hypothetical protein
MDLFDIATMVITIALLIWAFSGIIRDARKARREKKWREFD